MTPEEALLKYFNFSSFRPGQKEAIDALINSKSDVLCLFPTGAGKSICYQLPVLLGNSKFALVISPLIALMEDQIAALKRRKIPCAVLNSTISASERLTILSDLASASPTPKLVYVTPEQLQTPELRDALSVAKNNVAYLAVDEAHCISAWGHDFRPAFRKIAPFRQILGVNVPVIACTATATPKVRDDIIASLKMAKPLIIAQSFNRPNLIYSVKFKASEKNEDFATVLKCVKKLGAENCGIIYCFKREECDDLAACLCEAGFKAKAYHAGLGDKARSTAQTDWLAGTTKILVATIAFGMGVDKPNVRYVIHFSISKNMEGYYQESGRAGRDGHQSKCILFYSERDYNLLEWLTQKSKNEHALEALRVMKSYCLKPKCRRSAILEHFGEVLKHASKRCCDFCKDPKETAAAAENYFYRAPKKESYEAESADFEFEFENRGKRKLPEEKEEAPLLRKNSAKSRIWEKLEKLGK